MLLAHFHALASDAPFGLLAVKCELAPLGGAKLARAHKHVRREPKCTVRRRLPDVSIDCPQQLADAAGISEGRMISDCERRECSAKVYRGITLSASCCNGIPKYLANPLLGSVRGLVLPTPFNSAQNLQDFGRSKLRDGP
jgi:hypothetical protein